MKFVIPEIMLKPNKWNSIQIYYEAGNPLFGLCVNKPLLSEPTMLPILEFDDKKRFSLWLNTRKVVEK